MFKKRKWLWLIILFLIFVYLNNTSHLAKPRSGEPYLLAHRGLAQTFTMEGMKNDTCTAERIYPPEHPYLENTLPSMEAAFKAGADAVELDIKPTKDGQFAVFHDWTLDCRTNAQGMAKDYTMEQLKQLDIGYGYTADHGATYPFRGKGIGLMPSLTEVLERFPEQSFLIHIKSEDANEGKQLAGLLSKLPEQRLGQLTVYGGEKPLAALKQELPQLRAMSPMASLKSCLLPYAAIGWTGHVPDGCGNTMLLIPDKFAPWLWGWPNKLLNRMEAAGSRVIVTGWSGEGFSSGLDTPEDIKRLPTGYTGGIWTNRIDIVAPLVQGAKSQK
jgi:glycerophosphoryl diester phosphodiesterase